MKILLGGIPLGCHNIGDEAIIGCVVNILRRLLPDARLYVATDDQAGTEERLNVDTVPLYGFVSTATIRDFAQIINEFDCFIWAGATGLSDYPAVGLNLLRAARLHHVPSIVWNVGMDSELNPVFFRLHGKRRKLIRWAGLGLCDTVGWAERFLQHHIRRRIARELNHCALVVVRDEPSAKELSRCGVHNVLIGADSALTQQSREVPQWRKPAGATWIGMCISAQRQLSDLAGLQAMLKHLIMRPATQVIFIPMNPQSDYRLMSDLRSSLPDSDKYCMVEDCDDPAIIQAIAGQCDVVVSSRLHLLILAANTMTPGVGISRGSKIDNFLANYQQKSSGTVYNCDFSHLSETIQTYLNPDNRKQFQIIAQKVHETLLERLNAAEQKLQTILLNLPSQ